MKFVIVIVAFTLTGSTGPGAPPPGLAPLGWLAGCWELERGTRVIREMWMAPSGGMMLGSSRTVVAGAVRDYEHMRLTDSDGGLTFTALPFGQREVAFAGAVAGDSGFAAENPAHDFPQRISYRRLSPDSMIARIEGTTPAGARAVDFPMRRVRCEAG